MEVGETDDYSFAGDDGGVVTVVLPPAPDDSAEDGTLDTGSEAGTDGGNVAGGGAVGGSGNDNDGVLSNAQSESMAQAEAQRRIRIYVGSSIGGTAGLLLVIAAFIYFCTAPRSTASGSAAKETGFTHFSKSDLTTTLTAMGGSGGGMGDTNVVANPLFQQEDPELDEGAGGTNDNTDKANDDDSEEAVVGFG